MALGLVFGTAVVLESASGNGLTSTYDSTNNKVVIAYFSGTVGTSVVFQSAAGSTLTSENYIGMSSGVVNVNSVAQAIGSEVVFEAGQSSQIAAVFDSNSNKIVLAYQDASNSNYGTAIVGTVSGTSISFGTAAVFSAYTTSYISITFDSNSNKVVIAYMDNSNSQYGTAIVGTVSSTSISFGTAVVLKPTKLNTTQLPLTVAPTK